MRGVGEQGARPAQARAQLGQILDVVLLGPVRGHHQDHALVVVPGGLVELECGHLVPASLDVGEPMRVELIRGRRRDRGARRARPGARRVRGALAGDHAPGASGQGPARPRRERGALPRAPDRAPERARAARGPGTRAAGSGPARVDHRGPRPATAHPDCRPRLGFRSTRGYYRPPRIEHSRARGTSMADDDVLPRPFSTPVLTASSNSALRRNCS
jgi:hypothetical protein